MHILDYNCLCASIYLYVNNANVKTSAQARLGPSLSHILSP